MSITLPTDSPNTVRSNYYQDVIDRLAEKLDDCPPELLSLYALLALTTGEDTTLEHVHDAWAAWRNVTKPDHKSLVWFDQLDAETQAWDEPYRKAIVDVAREVRTARA